MSQEIHFGYRKRRLPAGVRAPFKAGQLWDMTDGARAFHKCRARLKALVGGLGGGKTYAAVREAGFLGFRNPGFTGIVVEPTWNDFEQYFIPAFDEALEEAGLERGRHWNYHGTKHVYTIRGGPRAGGFAVQLKSGDDPDAIVGANRAWAVCDEPARMPAAILVALKKRVRVGTEEIAMVGTVDPGSWVAKRRRKPAPGDAFFITSTFDNPRITQAYIDDLAAEMDETTFRALVKGEAVTYGGGAYRSFRDEPFNAKDPEKGGNVLAWPYDPGRPVILCMDNNKRPQCAVLAQLDGADVRVFDEVTLAEGAYSILVSTIVRKLGGKSPAGFIIAGDATPRGHVADEQTDWGEYELLAQNLRSAFPAARHQFKVPRSNPHQIDRLLAVNAKLCNVKGERRLLFDPRCTETIEDYRSVQTDADGNILKGRGVDPERTHHSDALDYYVAHEWPLKHGGRTRSFTPVLVDIPSKPRR